MTHTIDAEAACRLAELRQELKEAAKILGPREEITPEEQAEDLAWWLRADAKAVETARKLGLPQNVREPITGDAQQMTDDQIMEFDTFMRGVDARIRTEDSE